jgi:hypothetical protein
MHAPYNKKRLRYIGLILMVVALLLIAVTYDAVADENKHIGDINYESKYSEEFSNVSSGSAFVIFLISVVCLIAPEKSTGSDNYCGGSGCFDSGGGGFGE